MQNRFNWPLWHWHVEVSSICTLKCPRCPRQEVPNTLIQDQLRLDFFKNSFTVEVIQQIVLHYKMAVLAEVIVIVTHKIMVVLEVH